MISIISANCNPITQLHNVASEPTIVCYHKQPCVSSNNAINLHSRKLQPCDLTLTQSVHALVEPKTIFLRSLVELIHQWQEALDVPDCRVRLLLLDFSKAFDRVDHTLLLRKIDNLGVPDFLMHWLVSFHICQRRQRVKLGSAVSE